MLEKWTGAPSSVSVFAAVLGLLIVPAAGRGAEDPNGLFSSSSHLIDTVKQDYKELYLSPDRLVPLGAAFGVGAVMANTNIDGHIQDWYQDHVRSDRTDHLSEVAKTFGNGWYVMPVSVAAAAWGDKFSAEGETSPITTWGERSTRAYIAGGPVTLLGQWVTGARRPSEGNSHWRPFHEGHGVSGHAFVGAVPFLTAGRMCEHNPLARYLFYAASALPALSRINDNAHYPSQAFLGWFLAWEATDVVAGTHNNDRQVSLAPMMTPDGCGLGLYIRW
jgi:hypothetical protein